LHDDNVLEHRACILDPEYIGKVPFDIKDRERDSRDGSYRRRIIHCQAVAHSFKTWRENDKNAGDKAEAKRKKREASAADRAERKLGSEEKTESVPGQIARRNAVRRHVMLTRAFQLIRNKRVNGIPTKSDARYKCYLSSSLDLGHC